MLENLAAKFLNDVKLLEAQFFYVFQITVENIHSEMYSLLIDKYIQEESEKMHLFRAVETIPAIRKKAEWAARWINNENSFAERLVAYTAVEGILFSGSFCAIFWLKKRGLMPGLTFSNELISRDEGLHAEFGCYMYRQLRHPLPESTVHDIIRNAVQVERAFICDSLPCDLIGMNSRLMTQYIEYVSDRLLSSLGVSKIFNVANPFDWMDLISLQVGSASPRARRISLKNEWESTRRRESWPTRMSRPSPPVTISSPTHTLRWPFNCAANLVSLLRCAKGNRSPNAPRPP